MRDDSTRLPKFSIHNRLDLSGVYADCIYGILHPDEEQHHDVDNSVGAGCDIDTIHADGRTGDVGILWCMIKNKGVDRICQIYGTISGERWIVRLKSCATRMMRR